MANRKVSISTPCPSCNGALVVKEMQCPTCNLTIRADFDSAVLAPVSPLDRFHDLTPEQARFLEVFLRCRGIIRDVEAALGISYPTVRARLDALLIALRLADGIAGSYAASPPPTPPAAAPPAPPKPSAKDILNKLDSGAIDAQSALDALKS
jgi:hypothetical protein